MVCPSSSSVEKGQDQLRKAEVVGHRLRGPHCSPSHTPTTWSGEGKSKTHLSAHLAFPTAATRPGHLQNWAAPLQRPAGDGILRSICHQISPNKPPLLGTRWVAQGHRQPQTRACPPSLHSSAPHLGRELPALPVGRRGRFGHRVICIGYCFICF